MDKLLILSERLKRCGYKTEIFETGDSAARKIYETIKGTMQMTI